MMASYAQLFRKYAHSVIIGGAAVVPPLVYGFPHSEKPLKRYQEEWSSHTMGRADLIDMDILLMAEDVGYILIISLFIN